MTDDDLMGRFREGDADAFDALFDRHHAGVYNFARVMLHDADAAEDALQETFLAVARSAGGYAPSGRFRAWLLRIARNYCLKRLESLKAQKALLAALHMERPAEAAEETNPPGVAQSDELAASVRRAMEKLPDRQREALALYAFDRLTYQEIADVLAAPINTVKTLIRRARAALAETLEEGADRDL